VTFVEAQLRVYDKSGTTLRKETIVAAMAALLARERDDQHLVEPLDPPGGH